MAVVMWVSQYMLEVEVCLYEKAIETLSVG